MINVNSPDLDIPYDRPREGHRPPPSLPLPRPQAAAHQGCVPSRQRRGTRPQIDRENGRVVHRESGDDQGHRGTAVAGTSGVGTGLGVLNNNINFDFQFGLTLFVNENRLKLQNRS